MKSVTLDVADGEFLTLLGPSGCGKSTLLRMVAGLESPSAGEIRFGGERVDHLGPAARNIAMAFQNYALYPHMTVAENLGYPLRKRGVPRPERQRRIRETADLLQLEGLLARKPRELSGGQQQRVALGRAMIRDPAVYLFDEPLSNLDATLRATMRGELVRLREKVRGTMIFVTHDQVEAMTMSTRIAVMAAGEILQCGTPDEIYDSPRTRFVAAFVGTPRMNLIEMRVTATDRGATLTAPGFSVTLPDADGALAAMGAVILGIRAEDVLPGGDVCAGKIAVVESLGNEQIVTVTFGGTELLVRVPPRPKLRAGENFSCGLRLDKPHLFDPRSGERIVHITDQKGE